MPFPFDSSDPSSSGASLDLVEAARHGSRSALDELVRIASDDLRSYLERRTWGQIRRFVSVEDLLQETLLEVEKVLERLPSGANQRDFTAMLCRAGEWKIRTALRRTQHLAGESAAKEPPTNKTSSTRSGEVTREDDRHWVQSQIPLLTVQQIERK